MPSTAHPRRTRRSARSILLALFALLILAAPASAAPPQLEVWHRLNPAAGGQDAEHEQLLCLPGVQWNCRYDKAPDPGYHWDRTIAMFHGRDITGDLECPEWFEACDPSFTAIAGVANFSLAGGGAFRTSQVLVFTDGSGGIAPLYIWWVDNEFACPWYGSFEDALAANPDGSADDCYMP